MTQKPAASPGTRLIHSVVLLGLGASTIAAVHPELVQLWAALSQPYHWGAAPSPWALAAAAVAAPGALGLLALARLGRPIPLGLTCAMGLSFAAAVATVLTGGAQPTVAGANLKCLERARELNGRVNDELQKTGQVPLAAAALELSGQTPYLKRPYRRLDWHLEKVERTDVLPALAEPGWLLFHPAINLKSYAIACVGVSADGAPQLLIEQGKPVEYRGAYRPDTPW